MNRYQKIKLIGEGSFGKAFLVRDKDSKKQYVIKEINMSRMGAKEREDARKEVAVLAQLQHPNIVSYRESFEEVGNLYISMDYCEAGDLFSKINAQRGILMPEPQILDMFVQVCLSIKHIHDRKILHRDIKSQNIFITKGGIMKLGDFGIAKVMNSTLELARTCIGTPYYLSPEICENRPYNNKSDIWSLGCVLYEMTTLKHPFEAGSMKNLVLKIIRGTYPPVPPRYGYELRNLLSQLFKRNPRDRPSINAILKKPFIQERIKKFLNESEVQSEFSHTVLHGERLQKRLPPGGRPINAPVAKKPTPAPTPKYDPSSIYRNKVAQRRPASAANRAAPVGRQNSGGSANKPSSACVNRPPSAGYNKPSSAAAAQRNNDIVARRREMMEKERQRKAEVAARLAADVKSQHQRLVEKQKQDRINKGREQWRNNLLDSYGDQKDSADVGGPSEPPPEERIEMSPPSDIPRGNYARYNDILDKQIKDREAKMKQPVIGAGGDNPVFAAQRAAAVAQGDRQQGAVSADRARIVEDFRERQRQAMLNKAKGQADMGAAARPYSRPPSGKARGLMENIPPSTRNGEETEYLQRLKQIRLQNFNERRALLNKQAGRPDSREADRQRNLKIDALKAQAEERGRQLKAQLEKQRKEALAREQQAWQQAKPGANRAVPGARPASARDERQNEPSGRAGLARPASAQAGGGRAVPMKAVPLPGLTKALNAIGAEHDGKPAAAKSEPNKGPSMTNVMADIGVGGQHPPQQGISEYQYKVGGDRPKWGKPAATPLVPSGENPDRGKWEGETKERIDLSNLSLETTGSQMETTSAAPVATDKTEKRGAWGQPTVLKPASSDTRPVWGSPSGTVVNALQAATVIDSTTVTISPQQAKEAVQAAKQRIGETISVSKPLVMNKPFIPAKPSKPLTGATITVSKDQPDSLIKEDGKGADSNVTEQCAEGKSLADTSVPLFNKVPLPSTPASKMSADSDLDLVDLDLDDKEKKLIVSLERTQQPFLQKTSGLMISLTVGHFDCNKTMLRTCSEPDFSKLSHTAHNPFSDVAASANFADSDDGAASELDAGSPELKVASIRAGGKDSEPKQGGEMSEDSKAKKGQGKTSLEQEVEDGDDIIDEDDEDATLYEAELVALMASQSSTSTQESDTKYQLDSVTPTTPTTPTAGDDVDGANVDVDDDSVEEEGELAAQELQDAEDFEKMRETLQQIVQSEDDKYNADKKKTLHTTLNTTTLAEDMGSVQERVSQMLISGENKEEWVSDDSSGSDHGSLNEEDDMFCRLEESRANLEKQLGEATFVKAYRIVQAIHEDEEDSIEEGSKLVTRVLGQQNSHLYDKILHLVVADSVYLDDN